MINGLDALSAWVEVSSESESVCNFGGHERIHRTREREILVRIYKMSRAPLTRPLDSLLILGF